MNWISRKVVLSLRKYFVIEREEQVEVSIMGGFGLTCSNLRLRNSVVNSPTAALHVQQLTVNHLSVSYDSTRQEQLQVRLDGAHLVVAFNPDPEPTAPPHTTTPEQLQAFFGAVENKSTLKQRGFLGEELFQLKRMLGEYLVGKISLVIQNVDISLQYPHRDGKQCSVGLELGELNLKQRVVIIRDIREQENKEEELLCSLNEVSMYLGVSREEDRVEHKAQNREVLRRTRTIKKLYIMEKEEVKTFYGLSKNKVTVEVPQLNLRLNNLLMVELIRISGYVGVQLSDRPKLRPGQGGVRQVQLGPHRAKMRQGTYQWWQFAFRKVLERVEARMQFNILSNKKYRIYLFCLLYKYTRGGTRQTEGEIKEYEREKLTHSVMIAHSNILNRIHAIRSSPQEDEESAHFVNFVCRCQMIRDYCKKHGLQAVTYDSIRKSTRFFNIANCNEFIRQFTAKPATELSVRVLKGVQVGVFEERGDKSLLKECFDLEPVQLFAIKEAYLEKFYGRMVAEGVRWDRKVLSLEIHAPHFHQTKTDMSVEVPWLALRDADKIILKVNNFALQKENHSLYSDTNQVIISEKNQLVRLQSLFLNVDQDTAYQLLAINMLLTSFNPEPLSPHQEFHSFTQDNIYNRLPKHPFLQSTSDQSTRVIVERALVVTSLYDQNQYLTVDTRGVSYTAIVNQKPKLVVEQLSLSRSVIKEWGLLERKRLEVLEVEPVSTIMENSKHLVCKFEQFFRSERIDAGKGRVQSFSHYESITDILVPFILLQVSFQDIYYFELLMTHWTALLKNPYFFPKTRTANSHEEPFFSLAEETVRYLDTLHPLTKSKRTRLKLEGIELMVYGENARQPQNVMLTALIEDITYENKVYVLGSESRISVSSLYVEDCLGSKTFNHRKLVEMIEKQPPTEDPLIYHSKQHQEAGHLILYGQKDDHHGHEKVHQVRVSVSNSFDQRLLKKSSDVTVEVKPLFAFLNSEFYQIMTSSLNLIRSTARKQVQMPRGILSEAEEPDSGHEILEAKSIGEKTKLTINLQRFNAIVLHGVNPVYTISLLNTQIHHETQAYVTKYKVTIGEFFIVDISVHCGHHPIVFKAIPVECLYTQYQSELLKKKEKKSALLSIKMYTSELYYLNRKIKEVTNFIMSHFSDSKEEKHGPAQPQAKSYPFCYKVELANPVITLLRSSLSQEKMISEVDSLLLANYSQAFEEPQNEKFFNASIDEDFDNDAYESCIELNEQEVLFHSFERGEVQEQEEAPSTIYIALRNFYVFGEKKQHDSPIMYAPEVSVDLVGKELSARVEAFSLDFAPEDYALLIRITEENFGEAPVSYPKESVLTEEKGLGFKSNYYIGELVMGLRQERGGEKFGELHISELEGVNTLFTNGEKEDVIKVKRLNYQSCLNEQVEKIITMKANLSPQLREQRRSNPSHNSMQEEKGSGAEGVRVLREYGGKLRDQPPDAGELTAFFKDGRLDRFEELSSVEDSEYDTVREGEDVRQKDDTNIVKLGKWIGGMCRKCMCCCRSESTREEEHEPSVRAPYEEEPLRMHSEHPLYEPMVSLEESNIQSEEEILKFEAKVDHRDYFAARQSPDCMFMEIKGERSREKRIYMLVQHLDIVWERDQHLMTLVNFCNRPYAQPAQLDYVKEARFNNIRPFQMLTELSNSTLFAVQKDVVSKRAVQVDLHMLYNIEKTGDVRRGPGRSLTGIDTSFDVYYREDKLDDPKGQVLPGKELTDNRLSLSDPIRVIYERTSQVPYHNREPVENRERLLVLGVKEETVRFQVPVFIVKSLQEWYKGLFGKQQPKKEEKEEEIRVSSTKRIRRSSVDDKELRPKVRFDENALKKERERQGRKEEGKAPVQRNTMVKAYFVPGIRVEVESKRGSSFLSVLVEETALREVQMAKEQAAVRQQEVTTWAEVSYWNLIIGKFEPFLERARVRTERNVLERQGNENNRFRVESRSERDNNSYDYKRGLCVNLTTAFFHTYKELEHKYSLGNESSDLVFNEFCYDLTSTNPAVYDYMKMTKHASDKMMMSLPFHKNYPEELKNFFGKKFKAEDAQDLLRRKGRRAHKLKTRFHIDGLQVFLYHSFLEPKTKFKNITYRTPFRIYNMMNYELALAFTPCSRQSKTESWHIAVGFREFYSIPEEIYSSDILVHIELSKKNRSVSQLPASPAKPGLKRKLTSTKQMIRESDNNMSVKYLVQMHASMSSSQYHEMGRHSLYEHMFSVGAVEKRWIDRRDIVIRSGRVTCSVVSIKIEGEYLKDRTAEGQKHVFLEGSRVMLYDSLTVFLSPVTIVNRSLINFNITSCRHKKYEVPAGQTLELNEFPAEKAVKDIGIEFAEDIVHKEYYFLDSNFGTRVQTMLIDRMQSVNLKIIKETYNTCTVELYPDWLLINKTELEFQLKYEKKEFPIDPNSLNSLAIEEWRDQRNNTMRIKLYDHSNPDEDFHRFTTEADLVESFTVLQVVANNQRAADKEELQEVKACCCGGEEEEVYAPGREHDERVFQCTEVMLTIEESEECALTRNININYKYLLCNNMDFDLVLYQASFGEVLSSGETGVELATIEAGKTQHLFSYDFLPRRYFVKVLFRGQTIHSNLFRIDDTIRKSESLKLRQLNEESAMLNSALPYHKGFHHIRIDTTQEKYTSTLSFDYIDDEVVRFPFYINNTTNYHVKVTENGEHFKIKPRTRVPFSWSDLIDNSHLIEVEIEGNTREYSLKQKESFEPIVIRSEHLNRSNPHGAALFKRENCMVKWNGRTRQSLLIYDAVSKRIRANGEGEESMSMVVTEAEQLVVGANKISLIFKRHSNLEFYPSYESIGAWGEILREGMNVNIQDKIFFTIQSLDDSIMFFLHNKDISSDDDIRVSQQVYEVEDMYLSVITSSALRTEEIMLIHMGAIEYSFHDRLGLIEEGSNKYYIKKTQQTYKIKTLKINNQCLNSVNPVILSQIKKSNYPFLEFRQEKQHLILAEEQAPEEEEKIVHYKTNIFFLDEAEILIEAALIPEVLEFKKIVEQIQNQYAFREEGERRQVGRRGSNKQIYIDCLEIKPVKLTISVSFDSNIDSEFAPKLMSFLTLMPSGVENAIIEVDSYMFHHVFMEGPRLSATLQEYYYYELKKQILWNAGSIKILTPIQLVKGLGIGVKNIFYNPFYEFVNTQEIKSFGATMLEGLVSLFIVIFTVAFQVINGVFSFIAFFTFDKNFQSKREMLRKQIFKSPVDAFSYGLKWLGKVFSQFFINFTVWPCQYHEDLPCLGLIFGFLLAILNVIPWAIKLVVTLYDFFYLIGLGFMSWGYYEQDSMRFRSRPIRTFPFRQLHPYDFLTAKGNQIMRKNQIMENEGEEITYISHVEEGDQSKYLVLSNYRILYSSHQLSSCKEILLYNIARVVVGAIQRNEEGEIVNDLELLVELNIPDQRKCLCFDTSVSCYMLKLKDMKEMRQFLQLLDQNMRRQDLEPQIEDANLAREMKPETGKSIRL